MNQDDTLSRATVANPAPVNFFEHPYHDQTMVYHEAHVEDSNPDDSDEHHGPQLHSFGAPELSSAKEGFEHQTDYHHLLIDEETPYHKERELYHGHQIRQQYVEHHPSHVYDHYMHHQMIHEALPTPAAPYTATDVAYHYD